MSHRDQNEQHAQEDRDEGTGDGNSELGAGAREPTLEPRHAAEQPQRDRVDLDPLASGDP